MLISSHVVGFRLEGLGLGLGWISFFGRLFGRIGLMYLWLVPLVEINTLYQEIQHYLSTVTFLSLAHMLCDC